MQFSEKIKGIKPSATLEITSKAKRLKASGEDVVILAAGEPDFDTPEIIKNSAIEAIKQGRTRYTPSSGTEDLKRAICSKFKKDNNLEYDISNIIVSNGAKHSLYNALQVICNPGDEVLVLSPYWLSYPEMVKLAGGVPKYITLSQKNGFRVSADDIKKSITDRTKALILNSPSNPAGVVYTKKELENIAEICIAADIFIISDEIYENIIFDGNKHYSIASVSNDVKAKTIVINGVSKSFSMTGWRIGYLAADREIVSMISTLQSHATSNPCSISQAAAECALRSDMEDVLSFNNKRFAERRDVLLSGLRQETPLVPFIPGGAFYLFCDISFSGMDSISFARKLLEEKKVAVIPGTPFGHDDFIRISFAADMDTLKEGVKRIGQWLKV
jgi:aspartate aminotransferase